MPKKLKKPGKLTLHNIEIQGISKHGLWVLINEHEFFLPFTKYPWFVNATITQIYDVQLLHQKHLYWPTLDIDLELDSLKYPDSYPLIARTIK